VLCACAIGQLAIRFGGRWLRSMVRVCDVLVIVACAKHVALVGATVGAYGGRGIQAMLPHGPLELAAYSLALSLYVSSRREPLAVRRALWASAMSAAGLAIAAALEVMA
jgi:hypothetical protein